MLVLFILVPAASSLILVISPRLFGQGAQWLTLTYLRQAFTGATGVAIVNSLWVSHGRGGARRGHRAAHRVAGRAHDAARPPAGAGQHVAGAAAAVLAARPWAGSGSSSRTA